MNLPRTPGIFVILASFVIAFMLTILPLPSWAAWLRPEWVVLTLLYWVIALPHRIGLGIAWLLGLFLDALQHTLLGEHALAMVVITFIALKIHRQFRFFPLWQQAFSIMLLLAIYQFLRFWIQGIIGQLGEGWLYWLPVVTSGLLWPLVPYLLRENRQQLRLF